MTFKVYPTYCKPSFLQDLYGETFNVNSHHHQSIKRLGVDLIPIQYSGNNKCIEDVVHKSYPYIGVQWHPERLCKPKEKEKNCVDGTLILRIICRFYKTKSYLVIVRIKCSHKRSIYGNRINKKD